MSRFPILEPSSWKFETKSQTSHHNIVIIGSFSLYGLIISCIIANNVRRADRWFIALTIMAYIFSLISFINLMIPLYQHHWFNPNKDYTETENAYKISFACLVISTILAIIAVSLKKHVRDYDEMMGELVSTVWFMLILQIVFMLCSFYFGYEDFLRMTENDE